MVSIAVLLSVVGAWPQAYKLQPAPKEIVKIEGPKAPKRVALFDAGVSSKIVVRGPGTVVFRVYAVTLAKGGTATGEVIVKSEKTEKKLQFKDAANKQWTLPEHPLFGLTKASITRIKIPEGKHTFEVTPGEQLKLGFAYKVMLRKEAKETPAVVAATKKNAKPTSDASESPNEIADAPPPPALVALVPEQPAPPAPAAPPTFQTPSESLGAEPATESSQPQDSTEEPKPEPDTVNPTPEPEHTEIKAEPVDAVVQEQAAPPKETKPTKKVIPTGLAVGAGVWFPFTTSTPGVIARADAWMAPWPAYRSLNVGVGIGVGYASDTQSYSDPRIGNGQGELGTKTFVGSASLLSGWQIDLGAAHVDASVGLGVTWGRVTHIALLEEEGSSLRPSIEAAGRVAFPVASIFIQAGAKATMAADVSSASNFGLGGAWLAVGWFTDVLY